ncbi:hypothetical protein BHECKSOX2_545 [Bathymodiolus heckerae thiotrophic gill symbiont]|uniref:hypothetical protein n=1 Tax=Bathymodiolus heckerae thiotrophic gill symbiont TaxID=1052212 RepID=UPI0010B99E58|nr:hypothetical protein [Bathymodiolus heckerae thiotrophic gill symbiont]CAC9434897.1 hypothetical protein [uncultured Gammaproteobacteria bacterium]SMN13482.1 hypothetical protein BHECKSOX2_545 [Bathymodiolus heckerae thiotrophic gill symbiont]
MLKTTLATIFLIATTAQVQAEMTLKHGFYLSKSAGSIDADISGKHQDFSAFTGTNPEDITEKNARIYDGKISNARSFGYNLRYTPKVGFGYELGLYFTKIKMPTQNAALIHDDGSAFKAFAPNGNIIDVVVKSPSSHITTTDLYLGGLYNFTTVDKITPYVGLGYAKVKGNWHQSYYRGTPGGVGYGQSGKTKIDGHYVSAKAGVNFKENYNLELEHAKHKLHADAFRSFNINGSDSEFNRTSVNLIINF